MFILGMKNQPCSSQCWGEGGRRSHYCVTEGTLKKDRFRPVVLTLKCAPISCRACESTDGGAPAPSLEPHGLEWGPGTCIPPRVPGGAGPGTSLGEPLAGMIRLPSGVRFPISLVPQT